MTPTFRADHVGSFLRPAELLEARRAHASDRDLQAVEDRHILRVLDRQKEIGFDVFTDGELRRDAWQTDLSDAVAGVVSDYPVGKQTLPDGRIVELETHTKAVQDQVPAVRRITGQCVPFLKEHSPGPLKVTLPSPAMAARAGFQRGLTDRVYANRQQLLADFVPIYQVLRAELGDDELAGIGGAVGRQYLGRV